MEDLGLHDDRMPLFNGPVDGAPVALTAGTAEATCSFDPYTHAHTRAHEGRRRKTIGLYSKL